MKVLVIPQAYPTSDRPMLTPFIKEHTKQLQKLGYDVQVLNVDMLPIKMWNHRNCIFPQKKKDDGIIINYIGMRSVHGFDCLNSFLFYRKCKRLFNKYLKENDNPDIVISHFSQMAGFSTAKLLKKNKIPYIAIEHAGWLLSDEIDKFELFKLKQTLSRADYFICVSELLKESIEKKVGTDKKFKVISNMIADEYRFVPLIKKDKFIFFSAGNLYKGKKFDLLIKAFCNAFSVEDDVELRIAGSGIQFDYLNEIIKKNNRENQILLLGSLTKEKMKKEYIYSDSFVLASEHETFGIVYREAMAVGRPIITTNHQGFYGTLWDDDFGIKIPINDEEQLTWALKKMCSDYSEYSGKTISEKCIKSFSCESIMSSYAQIIETICQERNRA